jgi:hypothetical protein
MHKARLAGVALLGLIGVGMFARGQPPVPADVPRYIFNCRVTEQNEAGERKVVAQPVLSTCEGSPANFLSGGEFAVPSGKGPDKKVELVPYGISVGITARALEKNKVRLNVSLQDSRRMKTTGDRVRWRSLSVQSIESVRLGDTVKLELERMGGEGGRWELEVRVQDAK